MEKFRRGFELPRLKALLHYGLILCIGIVIGASIPSYLRKNSDNLLTNTVNVFRPSTDVSEYFMYSEMPPHQVSDILLIKARLKKDEGQVTRGVIQKMVRLSAGENGKLYFPENIANFGPYLKKILEERIKSGQFEEFCGEPDGSECIISARIEAENYMRHIESIRESSYPEKIELSRIVMYEKNEGILIPSYDEILAEVQSRPEGLQYDYNLNFDGGVKYYGTDNNGEYDLEQVILAAAQSPEELSKLFRLDEEKKIYEINIQSRDKAVPDITIYFARSE